MQEIMNIIKSAWSQQYWNHVNRNIGYITYNEQEKIRTTSIAILGVGGLGGPLAEQLVRSGCENLVICDKELFEDSNLNRQICKKRDIGQPKIKIIKNLLQEINPSVKINTFIEINEDNIYDILDGIKLVALTLDDPIASILIARICRELNVPVLETWAVPYLCTWWFTSESLDYETCYGLATHKKSISELSASSDIQIDMLNALLPKVLKFPGIRKIWNREKGALQSVLSGNIPARTLAPVARLSASILAFDMIFAGILEVKPKILAPNVVGFDYFSMQPINFQL